MNKRISKDMATFLLFVALSGNCIVIAESEDTVETRAPRQEINRPSSPAYPVADFNLDTINQEIERLKQCCLELCEKAKKCHDDECNKSHDNECRESHDNGHRESHHDECREVTRYRSDNMCHNCCALLLTRMNDLSDTVVSADTSNMCDMQRVMTSQLIASQLVVMQWLNLIHSALQNNG